MDHSYVHGNYYDPFLTHRDNSELKTMMNFHDLKYELCRAEKNINQIFHSHCWKKFSTANSCNTRVPDLVFFPPVICDAEVLGCGPASLDVSDAGIELSLFGVTGVNGLGDVSDNSVSEFELISSCVFDVDIPWFKPSPFGISGSCIEPSTCVSAGGFVPTSCGSRVAPWSYIPFLSFTLESKWKTLNE